MRNRIMKLISALLLLTNFNLGSTNENLSLDRCSRHFQPIHPENQIVNYQALSPIKNHDTFDFMVSDQYHNIHFFSTKNKDDHMMIATKLSRPIKKLLQIASSEFIVVCCEANTIYVYSVTTGQIQLTFSLHKEVVNDVTYVDKGGHLASVSEDRVIIIWSPETGKVIEEIKGPGIMNLIEHVSGTDVLVTTAKVNENYAVIFFKFEILPRLIRMHWFPSNNLPNNLLYLKGTENVAVGAGNYSKILMYNYLGGGEAQEDETFTVGRDGVADRGVIYLPERELLFAFGRNGTLFAWEKIFTIWNPFTSFSKFFDHNVSGKLSAPFSQRDNSTIILMLEKSFQIYNLNHSYIFSYKGDCVNYCPKSTYRHGTYCRPCHSSCSKCNGPSATNCLSCKHEFYLFMYKCMSSCPLGTITKKYRKCECATGSTFSDGACRKPDGTIAQGFSEADDESLEVLNQTESSAKRHSLISNKTENYEYLDSYAIDRDQEKEVSQAANMLLKISLPLLIILTLIILSAGFYCWYNKRRQVSTEVADSAYSNNDYTLPMKRDQRLISLSNFEHPSSFLGTKPKSANKNEEKVEAGKRKHGQKIIDLFSQKRFAVNDDDMPERVQTAVFLESSQHKVDKKLVVNDNENSTTILSYFSPQNKTASPNQIDNNGSFNISHLRSGNVTPVLNPTVIRFTSPDNWKNSNISPIPRMRREPSGLAIIDNTIALGQDSVSHIYSTNRNQPEPFTGVLTPIKKR